MERVGNMLNPNGKLVGQFNDFLQSQKHDKAAKDGGAVNKLEKSNNDKGVELVLSNGEKTVKVTYTKEELIKNIKTIESGNNQGKSDSVFHLDLDLEKILTQETLSSARSVVTAGSDPFATNDDALVSPISNNYGTNEIVTSGSPKLNNLQISLLTADDLELNLELKVGNDILVVGNNSSVSFNKDIQEDMGEDIFIIGNHSKVTINSNSVIDNSDDIIIVGNNSDVSISSNIGIDNGNDTIIIGNHSNISINSNVEVDNGSDTLIVGNASKVVIDSEVKEDNSNDTIIIGNNSELHYKGSVGKDNGSDTIILGNNSSLEIEGNIGTSGGNSVLVLGHNVKISIKFSINEDFENRELYLGSNKDKALEELNELGKRLGKFKVGKTSLKDIIDNTIDDIKKKLINIQKFKFAESMAKDNYSNLNYLNLAVYRYFNRQLSGIEVMYSYANTAYMKNKQL
jgi:hypothetical protein